MKLLAQLQGVEGRYLYHFFVWWTIFCLQLSFNSEDEFEGKFFERYSTYTNRITWTILLTAFTLLQALADSDYGKPNYTSFRIVLAGNIIGLARFAYWSISVIVESHDEFIHAPLATKIYISSIIAVYVGSTLEFALIFFKYTGRPFGGKKEEEKDDMLDDFYLKY